MRCCLVLFLPAVNAQRCNGWSGPCFRLTPATQIMVHFWKQEESARERALCQLTECFFICEGNNERKA